MIPKVRTETARKAFYFNGSKLFNNIPIEMKEYNSVVIFKNRILEFFRSSVFLVIFLLLLVLAFDVF